MSCPHYNSDNRTCGLKSEHYGELFPDTVEDYCKFNFRACSIFIEHPEEIIKKPNKGIEKATSESNEENIPSFLKKDENENLTFLRKIVHPHH